MRLSHRKVFLFLSVAFGLVALPRTARALDPCWGIHFKPDPFGGGEVATQILNVPGLLSRASVTFEHKGGTTELILGVQELGVSDGNVAAGIEVPVAFADGRILKLRTAREAPRVFSARGSASFTVAPHVFLLDAAALDAFATALVSVIRLPTTVGSYDWTPNFTLQKRLMTTAACFASHTEP